jgi:hypothetical protein
MTIIDESKKYQIYLEWLTNEDHSLVIDLKVWKYSSISKCCYIVGGTHAK